MGTLSKKGGISILNSTKFVNRVRVCPRLVVRSEGPLPRTWLIWIGIQGEELGSLVSLDFTETLIEPPFPGPFVVGGGGHDEEVADRIGTVRVLGIYLWVVRVVTPRTDNESEPTCRTTAMIVVTLHVNEPDSPTGAVTDALD